MVFVIHQHELATSIHVSSPHPEPPLPPPSPPYPSGLSQSSDFGWPISCIELALVICFTYGNVHVSVLRSPVAQWLKKKKKIVLCLCFFFLKKTVIIRMFFRFCVPSKNCIHCVVFKFTCFFFFS